MKMFFTCSTDKSFETFHNIWIITFVKLLICCNLNPHSYNQLRHQCRRSIRVLAVRHMVLDCDSFLKSSMPIAWDPINTGDYLPWGSSTHRGDRSSTHLPPTIVATVFLPRYSRLVRPLYIVALSACNSYSYGHQGQHSP